MNELILPQVKTFPETVDTEVRIQRIDGLTKITTKYDNAMETIKKDYCVEIKRQIEWLIVDDFTKIQNTGCTSLFLPPTIKKWTKMWKNWVN